MKFVRFNLQHDETILQGIVSEEGIQEIVGDIFTDWDYPIKY